MSILFCGEFVPTPILPSTIKPLEGAADTPAYDDPIAILLFTSIEFCGFCALIPTLPVKLAFVDDGISSNCACKSDLTFDK